LVSERAKGVLESAIAMLEQGEELNPSPVN
jgi:hypothetical protein